MAIQGYGANRFSVAPIQPIHGRSRFDVQRLDAQRVSSFQLDLKTAEGDKVTISAEALSALSAHAGPDGQGSAAGKGLQVNIKVDGDLNEQELKDIVNLAQALGSAVKDAKAGNLEQAARDVADTREGSSVASFDFAYRAYERYRYAAETAGSPRVRTQG